MLMDRQEAPRAFTCEVCGGDIYVGEEYYYLEPIGHICVDCMGYAHRYDAEPEL